MYKYVASPPPNIIITSLTYCSQLRINLNLHVWLSVIYIDSLYIIYNPYIELDTVTQKTVSMFDKFDLLLK